MKNLRQFLCRSGFPAAKQRQRRPALSGYRGSRRLSSEALERRELLAGDLLASNHNYWRPYDVNDDGRNTARDALAVINYLGQGSSAGELASDVDRGMFYDVNADNRVSPADALGVINALSRGEGAGELVELLLNARDANDQLIVADSNGDVNVEVNEPFFLEISYDDLRLFDKLGVFQIYADMVVSQADVLEPILNETQRLVVQAEIFDAIVQGDTTSTLTFSIEGSGTTYESNGLDFVQNGRAEIIAALTAFGYTSDQYTINELSFGPRNDLPDLPGGNKPSDIGYEIHWVGDMFADQDLPDISIAENFPTADIPTQTVEFAPRNPDGSINSSAVRFNIDTFSRTYNNDEQFYTSLNRGLYSATDGFTDVGGLGPVPSQGGGIPQLSDDGMFHRPFDAFSLQVRLISPVTDFTVTALPGQDEEFILLYGRDDPIQRTDVLVDGDHIVTINATTANQSPVVSAPVALTFGENDGVQNVDLLANASDPDGDTLTAVNVTLDSGNAAGITVNGDSLTVDPNAYDALNDGQQEVIVYSYDVSDGDLMVSTTATITITGITDPQNQSPVVSAPVAVTFGENDGVQNVDLLANASDPDGDTLTAVNVTLQVGNAAGVTVNGNSLSVNPNAYDALNDGQQEVITYTYDVSDGGLMVSTTATITITGVTDPQNQSPVVSGPISVTFNEDQTVQNVDLLANASDPDGDTLNIANLLLQSGDASGVTVNGNSLSVDPDAYDALNDGQQVVIVYTYNVTDGDLQVSTSATITITGITDNRAPQVSAPVTATFNEDQGVQNVDLLANASDLDGDTLNVANLVLQSGDNSGIAINGNSLTVTPGAYGSLNDGQSAVIVYSYDVSDGDLSVSTTATVTITGITDIVNQSPVVSAPVSVTFNEDQPSQNVDLLANATDPDMDTLNVANLNLQSGDASGVTVNGNSLSVDPNAYDALNDGQQVVIVYTYDVTDGALSVSTSATITITGITDNRPPTVGAPVSASFSEQDGSGSVNLLAGANDPDGDTLSVVNLSVSSGNAGGITQAGNSLNVDPDFYGFLVDGESEVVTYSYNVTDGEFSVSQSATITINGFNDPPRARDDNGVIAFVDVTQDIAVLANDDAGDGEVGQSLTVVSATSLDGNATVVPNADGTVAFTPDAGFTGSTSFTYTIEDAGGKQASATVNVTVQDFNPSSIGGAVFVDHVENIGQVVANGASAIRDGLQDADEPGVGGASVHLHSDAADNVSGQSISLHMVTDLTGGYDFTNVAPGSYTISVTVGGESLSTSQKVIYVGADEQHVGVGLQGGQDVNQVNFPIIATAGSALTTVDILASSYLRTNQEMSVASNGGREGGVVSLAADGTQNFFIAGEGFDGVVFAELVLNDAHDSALLTIVEADGDVLTARLSDGEFVVTNSDGFGIQFFGGLNDHNFVPASNDSAILDEFDDYMSAVDEYFSGR